MLSYCTLNEITSITKLMDDNDDITSSTVNECCYIENKRRVIAAAVAAVHQSFRHIHSIVITDKKLD